MPSALCELYEPREPQVASNLDQGWQVAARLKADSGCQVLDSGFRVWGLGCRGLGFRGLGFRGLGV